MTGWQDVVAALAVQMFMLLQCSITYMLLRLKHACRWAPDAEADDDGRPAAAALSVLIPAFNEAKGIKQCLALLAANSHDSSQVEVIVAIDSGSTDGTKELAGAMLGQLGFAASSRCIDSEGGRGPALAAATRASTGRFLLFLHADTRLAPAYDRLVPAKLQDRAVLATAFRFALDLQRGGGGGGGGGGGAQDSLLRIPGSLVMEATVNVRSGLLQLPFGDQALAMRRTVLDRIGGVPEVPIMEDFIMVQRLRRLHAQGQGRIYLFPTQCAYCSPRRWERNGVWRTNLVNQAVMLWYNFGGATPPQVFRFYYAKDVRSAPRVVQWVARLAGFADGGKR